MTHLVGGGTVLLMTNTESKWDRYEAAEARELWEDRAELDKSPVMLTDSERRDLIALLRGEYGEVQLGGVSLAHFALLADHIGQGLPHNYSEPATE